MTDDVSKSDQSTATRFDSRTRSSPRLRVNRHTVAVPSRMYADTRLKAGHRDILGLLAVIDNADGNDGRHGWVAVTFGDIETLTGRSRTSVTDAVRELVKYGYLEKRGRTDAFGASAANQYKIVYDAELPLAADRWATCLSPDGIVFSPRGAVYVSDPDGSIASEPVRSSANSGGSANSDPSGMDGSTGSDPSLEIKTTKETKGVRDTGPVLMDGVRDDGPLSRKKDRILSISDEIEREARSILQAFRAARAEAFPSSDHNAFGHASERGELAAIAQWLNQDGARADSIAECLRQRVAASAQGGLEAPYSVKRYTADVLACVEADANARDKASTGPGLPEVPAAWRTFWPRFLSRLSLAANDPLRSSLDRVCYIGRPAEQDRQLVLAVPSEADFRRISNAGIQALICRDLPDILPGVSEVELCVSASLCSRRFTLDGTENNKASGGVS